MSCLYVLEIWPLLVALFATIFSHFIGCLFGGLFFLEFPLLCKNLYVWLGPICVFVCLFVFYCLGRPKNIGMISVKECLPMFSSSFMVSCLTFKSLRHFEFISLQVGRCFLTSLIYTQLSSLPSTLAKEYTCPVHFLHTCVFCQRLTERIWIYFWVLCSVSLIYISVFVLVPNRFDYCSFVVLSEVLGELCHLSSPAPPKIALVILSLSWFHIHFFFIILLPLPRLLGRFWVFHGSVYIFFFYSSSVKNVMGDLIGITLNLKIAFGSIAILAIFLIQEHGISFNFFELPSVFY